MASVPLSNYGMMKVYTEQKKIRKFSNILDKSFSLYIEYILIKKFYMNNFEYRGVWNMYQFNFDIVQMQNSPFLKTILFS